MNYCFGKSYKLCSQKIIDNVYNNGVIVKKYPFIVRVLRTELPSKSPFQIVISAPKRNFKQANKRNRIKRLCKESIRLNKHILENYLTDTNQQIALFLIFTGKEEIPLYVLNKKTKKLFESITKQLKEA